jgi:hemolysin-activating ACP:hemolysin acyltransferase
MNAVDSGPRELGEQFLKSLDKEHIGAATSKLISANIGDLVVILSRSPAHKHYSFADLEWMVLPPVLAGQCYIVEARHREQGFRTPIAALTWAFVSEDVDKRLAQQCAGSRVCLRPDEWRSGEIAWLIDVVGVAEGVEAGLRWLKDGPFKDRTLKLFTNRANARQIATLDQLTCPASYGDQSS